MNENDIKLNMPAKQALIKSHFNYFITNIFVVLAVLCIVTITCCKMNCINIYPATFWNIFKSPEFYIPVLIAIIIKDILKYIFCGMSENEKIYLREAEKENPKAEGVSSIIGGNSAKQRFSILLALFGLLSFLLIFAVKKVFNPKVMVTIVCAYCYTVWHSHLTYLDVKNVLSNKLFYLAFFVVLGITTIISNRKKTDIEVPETLQSLDIFHQAETLQENEQYKETIDLLLTLEDFDEYYDAEKLLILAQCYSSLYDESKAVEYYKAALEKYLKLPEYEDTERQCAIIQYIGQCYESLNNNEKAFEYYNHSSELQPNNSAFLFSKARILEKNGELEQAVKLTEKCISMENNIKLICTYYSNIIIWHQNRNDFDTAMKYANKLLETDSENEFAILFKADYSYHIGNNEELQYYCNKLLDMGATNYGRIYPMLGDSYAYEKNYSKALKYYSDAIEYWNNFEYPDVLTEIKQPLAYLYFAKGYCLLKLEQDPDIALHSIKQAESYGFDKSKCDEAVSKINQLIENINKKDSY